MHTQIGDCRRAYQAPCTVGLSYGKEKVYGSIL